MDLLQDFLSEFTKKMSRNSWITYDNLFHRGLGSFACRNIFFFMWSSMKYIVKTTKDARELHRIFGKFLKNKCPKVPMQ